MYFWLTVKTLIKLYSTKVGIKKWGASQGGRLPTATLTFYKYPVTNNVISTGLWNIYY